MPRCLEIGKVIYFGGSGDFEIKGDSILAEFINFSNNAEEIKQKYETEVNGATCEL